MSIAVHLANIHQQIQQVSQENQRLENSVKLLAVTKTKPVVMIEQAIVAGQRAFGENYVQEGVEKIQYFADHPARAELEWHFIGALQSNKTRIVANHFDWVQTLDRLKIATRLSEQRPAERGALNVLIQINISDENAKAGIPPAEMIAFAHQISSLPNLRLRGLMAIPKPESDPARQRIALAAMHQLFLQLQGEFEGIDTLSMGMSGDLSTAIACGSTMVRIGSAIFGERNP